MLSFRGVRVYHHPKGTNVLENPSGLGNSPLTTPSDGLGLGKSYDPTKLVLNEKDTHPSGDICMKIYVDFVAQLPVFFFSLARQNPPPAAKTSLGTAARTKLRKLWNNFVPSARSIFCK